MEVVIVSNGKTEYLRNLTLQAIKTSKCDCLVVEQTDAEYPCRTIHYDFPFNYNKCLNLGYKFTKGNVCFANNDVLFGDNWWECERYLDEYGSLSLLNPGWAFHKKFTNKVNEGYRTGYELCGWGLIVSRATMDITGGFDEDVEFWGSDDLWGSQLIHHGIKHALLTEYQIHHLTSQTLCKATERSLIHRYTGGQVPNIKKAKLKYGTH